MTTLLGRILWVMAIASSGASQGLSAAYESFDMAAMGPVNASIDRDQILLPRVTMGTFWRVRPQVSIGPVIHFVSTDDEIQLFDRFRHVEFDVSMLVQRQWGSWSPFIKASVAALSYFQADGQTRGKAGQDVYEFGYRLEGKSKGMEVGLGAIYSVNRRFSVFAEVAQMAKRLYIETAKHKPSSASGASSFEFNSRRGLSFTGRPGHPFSVDSQGRNKVFSATAASVGLLYHM